MNYLHYLGVHYTDHSKSPQPNTVSHYRCTIPVHYILWLSIYSPANDMHLFQLFQL